MSEYILNVGKEGKDRLELMSQFLNPYSRQFLLGTGIQSGMRVLEIGCGAGAMTTWLAQQVGQSGHITALDSSAEQLQVTRERMQRSGLNNVDYVCHNINEFQPTEADFDLIYSRFVLIHLPDVKQTLQHYKKLLGKMGLIAVEEPIVSDIFTYPMSDLWETAVSGYKQLSERKGLNPDLGESLYAIVLDAGLKLKSAGYVQAVMEKDTAVDYLNKAFAELAETWVDNKILTAAEYTAAVNRINSNSYADIRFSTFHRVAQIAATR